MQVDPIVLRIGDALLRRVSTYNYLGFTRNESLTFASHINHILSGCKQKVCWLAKIRRFISEAIAVRLYKSLITSRLQYGSFSYRNATRYKHRSLQKIQNKALLSIRKLYVKPIT